MPKSKTQRDRRRYFQFRDCHERKWGAEIEKETGDPCSEIHPVGWSAPVLPPQKYLRVVPGEMGRLDIAYDEWISDLAQRLEEWTAQLEGYAYGMFGERAGEMLVKRPAELMRLVGPPPLSDGPVKACLAGNRWALGFEKVKRPAWADDYPDWPFNRKAKVDDLSKFRDDPDDAQAVAQPLSDAEVAQFLDEDDEDAGEMLDGGEDGGEMAALAASATAERTEDSGARRNRQRARPKH